MGFVLFKGSCLPPRHLRYCGERFRDDRAFLESGENEAQRLVSSLELHRGSSLLEIGCGPGRLAIGLLRYLGPINWYHGIDIDRKAIQWCTRFISRYHPTFRFEAIDASHDRYNPTGQPMDERFSLPFAAESFDIIYLHSVFANMVEYDVRVYAREFQRLLKPDGRVFLTAFVEEEVPPVTLNPEGYVMPCTGPLHIARYEKTFFFSLFTDHGLSEAVANFAGCGVRVFDPCSG